MGWKCAPQIVGLVRGEPKPGQKHRANGKAIAMEAGYERVSRSETLDRSRSKYNEYFGYKSGKKFWETMEAEADEYRVQVKGKTKAGEEIIREKGLQHNAVVGWAVIYNPPSEICSEWDHETYEKFFRDCRECMSEISPIFRKENIKMSSVHWDEGIPPENKDEMPRDAHVHDLGVCKDENGHYCGNQIDAKLLIKINSVFPKMMRQRGWEMDDLDTTDFERSKNDEEYRQERNEKRKRSGLSVNSHLRQKSYKMAEDASRLIEDALEVHDAAVQKDQEVKTKQSKFEEFHSKWSDWYKGFYKEMAGEEYPEDRISLESIPRAGKKFKERLKREAEVEIEKSKEQMLQEARSQIESERQTMEHSIKEKLDHERTEMEAEFAEREKVQDAENDKRRSELDAREAEIEMRDKQVQAVMDAAEKNLKKIELLKTWKDDLEWEEATRRIRVGGRTVHDIILEQREERHPEAVDHKHHLEGELSALYAQRRQWNEALDQTSGERQGGE